MWKNWKEYIICAIIAVIIVAIMVLLSGCQGHAVISTDIPRTAADHMRRAVARTDWFGTFCLLNFFGGIVAVCLGQRKIGGAIIIAAIATICLGLAIHRFPTWLAIIGFTGSIIAVGYSILIKNKALIEIIQGIQQYRKNVTKDSRPIDYELDDKQSDSTKKIVKQVKEKINGK